jgi:hypothetical protein
MKLNPVIKGRVSDELYEKSIAVLNENPLKFSSGYKNRIIHMIDAVSRGYISTMEAYDALEAPYFHAFLETRKSAYVHLIR